MNANVLLAWIAVLLVLNNMWWMEFARADQTADGNENSLLEHPRTMAKQKSPQTRAKSTRVSVQGF